MNMLTPDHLRTCQEVLTLLRLAQGFEIIFIECNSRPLQQAVEEYLTREMEDFRWISIWFEDAIANLREALLARQLPPLDRRVALSIHGLEYSIHDDGRAAEVVARLNVVRDLLPDQFPCPMALWLPTFALQHLARFAPDLWSWRAGVFYFDIESEHESLRPTISRENPQDNYSKTFREKEIAFLTPIVEAFQPAIATPQEIAKQAANMLQLARHHGELGSMSSALQYAQRALTFYQQINDQKGEAVALNDLGVTYNDLGEHRKAIGYYEQALVIKRQVYGEGHQSIAISYNNLGSAWQALGDHRKAIGYYEQALAIGRQVFGDAHPKVAIRYNNLGSAWDDLGDHRKAIGYFEQALAIDRQAFGDAHPNVARDYNNLGGAWDDLGDHRKAIGYFEQALAINRQVYGDVHPQVAINNNNLGGAWDALGDHRKAIGYYEQALAIDRQVYGEVHPAVAREYNNLGSAWEALGERHKAQAFYEQALAIFMQVFGAEHPSTRTVQKNLDLLLQETAAPDAR